jgi:hypothetical protein
MMKIEELRRALRINALQDELVTGIDADGELKTFDRLLVDYADLSIDEFCSKARRGLKKKNTSNKPRSSASLNEIAIVRYLIELDRTKSDNHQFEQVVFRMKNDKQIRVGEAREIAKRFLGRSRIYKTKADIYKVILQRQIADVRATGKAERIADIF